MCRVSSRMSINQSSFPALGVLAKPVNCDSQGCMLCIFAQRLVLLRDARSALAQHQEENRFASKNSAHSCERV